MKRSNPEKALRRLERVTDNGMFLVAVRYYTALLKPGEWLELPPPRRAGIRKVNSSWSNYLWVVRRLLYIASRPGSITEKGKRTCEYRLMANYMDTLYFATGLKLSEPFTRSRFEKLPYDFRLPDNDPATRSFSAQHPHVLERAKAHLWNYYADLLRSQGIDPPLLVPARDLSAPEREETVSEAIQSLKLSCPQGTTRSSEKLSGSPFGQRRPPTGRELVHSRALGFLSRVAAGE
jgi:hypothetical protein